MIMNAMAFQITGVSFVCSTICSGADKEKHQASGSLAVERGIHRWPVDSPHKGPVTRKMFPFDDVIMLLRIDGGGMKYPPNIQPNTAMGATFTRGLMLSVVALVLLSSPSPRSGDVPGVLNPHETARYGEIASAILNFFVCSMEMG